MLGGAVAAMGVWHDAMAIRQDGAAPPARPSGRDAPPSMPWHKAQTILYRRTDDGGLHGHLGRHGVLDRPDAAGVWALLSAARAHARSTAAPLRQLLSH